MPLVPSYYIKYEVDSVCNTHYQNGLRSEFHLQAQDLYFPNVMSIASYNAVVISR